MMITKPLTKACLPSLFVLFSLAVATPNVAYSQVGNTEAQTLNNKINQLDNQIQTLSRYIYRNNPNLNDLEAAAQSASQDTSNGGNVASNKAIVDAFESRISELQSQLSGLTGQIERLQFDLRNQSEQMKAYQSRIEFLEGRISTLQATPDEQRVNLDVPETSTTIEQRDTIGVLDATPLQEGEMEVLADDTTVFPDAQDKVDQTSTTKNDNLIDVPQNQEQSLTTGSAAGDYDQAFSLLKDKNFDQAETAFSQFLESYPSNDLAPNARYWLAETYYVRGNYAQSSKLFAEAFQKDPEGSKASDNLLKLGMSLVGLDKKKESCVTFKELLKRFPDASSSVKQRANKQIEDNGCE